MKDQLISYVNLLFAGAPDAGDIRQEILQNTLDRYDDLIAQGKMPQAAYSLAIAGIGDVSELLGDPAPAQPQNTPTEKRSTSRTQKGLQAIAICLYILCPVPVIALGSLGDGVIGVCALLAMVAVATALMVFAGGKTGAKAAAQQTPPSPSSALRRTIHSIIWAIGVCAYFVVSFITQAWGITWLIFIIATAVERLAGAILDLKEAQK